MNKKCACCGKVTPEERWPDSECWTRDEAIAVMCRGLARLLEQFGDTAAAQAVRIAEVVLRQPTTMELHREVRELRAENERLRHAQPPPGDVVGS